MSMPLATFTPSLIDPDTLERLFVAREPVLADLVARAAKAAVGRTRAHRMIVGTRGAGKTHLLSLANHRISQLSPAPTIAWLAEDPWMIDGHADLLREILAASSRDGGPTSAERRRMPSDVLEHELRERAARNGPIVVLAENFDRVLDTIDAAGQRRLRRFMENDRALLLLVTATRLTAGLLRQDSPFYGFFSTLELPPLTVEQATEMLARIAGYRGDEALVNRLRDPAGTDRYRLAAIDALAGGQPRVWALLASALTVDGLDSLADVLLTRFDDLTPYYQEQLGRLAPRERKVVRTLADLDRALNVKELAEELDVDQKSLAKTVSTLRRQGWLAEVPIPLGAGDARKTHFELAEPLARLAFQLKDNRGEAIPLLVTFLSAWFSREELASPLDHLSDFVRRHLNAAAGADALHEIAEVFGLRSADVALGFVRPGLALHRPRPPEAMLTRFVDALDALSHRSASSYLDLPSTQRHVLSSAVEEHGVEGAQRLCIELGSGDSSWIARAERLAETGADSIANRRLVAAIHEGNGRREAAITLLDDVLRECLDAHGPDHPLSLDTRLARLEAEFLSSDATTRVSCFGKLMADSTHALGPKHSVTIRVRVGLMFELARINPLQALDMMDEDRAIWGRSRENEILQLITRMAMLSLAPEGDQTISVLPLMERALADATRILGKHDRSILRAGGLIESRRVKEGDTTLALSRLDALSRDQARVMGPDHPDTIWTLQRLNSLKFPEDRPVSEAAVLNDPGGARADSQLGLDR